MNIIAALLLKAKLYILLAPFAITMTGAGMNQVVLYANGGKFPVMMNERIAHRQEIQYGLMDDIHCLMTDRTHLNFLADYINLHVVIMSPGDVLIELGEMIAAYSLVVWGTLVTLELVKTPKAIA